MSWSFSIFKDRTSLSGTNPEVCTDPLLIRRAEALPPLLNRAVVAEFLVLWRKGSDCFSSSFDHIVLLKPYDSLESSHFSSGSCSCRLFPALWWVWVPGWNPFPGKGGSGWSCRTCYSWGFDSGSSSLDLADRLVGCCGTSPNGGDDDGGGGHCWTSCSSSGGVGSRESEPQSDLSTAGRRCLPSTHSTSRQGSDAPSLRLQWASSQIWHPLEGRRKHYWLAQWRSEAGMQSALKSLKLEIVCLSGHGRSDKLLISLHAYSWMHLL